jgi:hypothetical protein
MNENVTFDQTSKQAFNVMSPMIRDCNLVNTRGKPNKEVISKKMHLFEGSPSIKGTIIYIYIYINCKRNGDVEIGNDMKDYKIDIRELANK